MNKKDRPTLPIKEALAFVKENCKAKFDSTIELHINLGVDPKKQDQMVRATVVLPHGTGNVKKVAVFADTKVEEADLQLTEADINKIESGDLKPKADFDVIVAEPKYMAKLAKVAKILGPQGLMPSPKAGTVTDDPAKAVSQIKKGKVEIKTEQTAPISHLIIGKKSFSDEQLMANFQAVMDAVKQARPAKIKAENFVESAFLTASMSPSVQLVL